MMLFFRFIWPRSWRSFSVWIPLIAVGTHLMHRTLTRYGLPLRACSPNTRPPRCVTAEAGFGP